jgi:3-oxoacyl-[acyl-carrier protein] reductase
MDLHLTDRVFVVTGASGGLGLSCARSIVSEGGKVVVAARREDALADAVAALGTDRAVAVVADLADPDAGSTLVQAAVQQWGRMDGAVVSVGGPPIGSVSSITDAQWRDAFDSVFLGAVRVCRAVREHTESAGSEAAIALVLSTSVKGPVEGLATSNGLRPGLAMLAKTMADEWGPSVRINALLPGRILTSRLEALEESTPDPAATRARYAGAIPLGRYGTPEEFGDVAAFVISPRASYLNGAMIPVDGGLSRSL